MSNNNRDSKARKDEFEIVKELVKTYLQIKKTIDDLKLEAFRDILSLTYRLSVRRILREIVEEALSSLE